MPLWTLWRFQTSKSAADSVQLIKPGQTYVGKQGFSYGAGVSTETVGAKKVCLNVLPVPPGAKAKVHYHEGIETIAYLLEGECSVYYGDELEYRVRYMPGTKFTCPKMCLMPHTIRAPHRVSGLSYTHPVAIRMASFYCQTWTLYSPKNSKPSRAASHAALARCGFIEA
jgi:uncharacterized RmlC-like cupin family protein